VGARRPDWLTPHTPKRPRRSSHENIAYRAAIREALAEEMTRDESIRASGEDIEPAGSSTSPQAR